MKQSKLLFKRISLVIASVCLLILCACGEAESSTNNAETIAPTNIEQVSVSGSASSEENVNVSDKTITESEVEYSSNEADTYIAASTPEQTEAPITESNIEPTAQPTAAPTVEPTAEPTPTPTTKPTSAPTEKPVSTPQPKKETVYVLNTKTMKIHNTWCNSVEKIKPENYKETTESIEELEKQGYVKCKQKGDW